MVGHCEKASPRPVLSAVDDRNVDTVWISKRISSGDGLMVFCGNWRNWRKFRLRFWIALAYAFRPPGKSVLTDVRTFFSLIFIEPNLALIQSKYKISYASRYFTFFDRAKIESITMKKKTPIDTHSPFLSIISQRIKRSFVIFTPETWNLSIRNEYRFPIK